MCAKEKVPAMSIQGKGAQPVDNVIFVIRQVMYRKSMWFSHTLSNGSDLILRGPLVLITTTIVPLLKAIAVFIGTVSSTLFS